MLSHALQSGLNDELGRHLGPRRLTPSQIEGAVTGTNQTLPQWERNETSLMASPHRESRGPFPGRFGCWRRRRRRRWQPARNSRPSRSWRAGGPKEGTRARNGRNRDEVGRATPPGARPTGLGRREKHAGRHSVCGLPVNEATDVPPNGDRGHPRTTLDVCLSVTMKLSTSSAISRWLAVGDIPNNPVTLPLAKPLGERASRASSDVLGHLLTLDTAGQDESVFADGFLVQVVRHRGKTFVGLVPRRDS